MEWLDERGIAGKAARIEVFHLLNEFLYLLGHLRIFAHGLAKLIQIAQAVVVGALRGNRGIIGVNWRPSARRIISRVEVAVHAARGSAAGIRVAGTIAIRAVAHSRAWAPDGTAATLASLLPALALCLSLSLSLAAL